MEFDGENETGMLRRAICFDTDQPAFRSRRPSDPYLCKELRVYKDKCSLPLGLRFIDPTGAEAHRVQKEYGTIAVVDTLVPGGLAEQAGVMIGDQIVSINDRDVDGPAQCALELRNLEGYVRLSVLPHAFVDQAAATGAEPEAYSAASVAAEAATSEAAAEEGAEEAEALEVRVPVSRPTRLDSGTLTRLPTAMAMPALKLADVEREHELRATGDASEASSSNEGTPRRISHFDVPDNALCAIVGNKGHVRLSVPGSGYKMGVLASPGKPSRPPSLSSRSPSLSARLSGLMSPRSSLGGLIS